MSPPAQTPASLVTSQLALLKQLEWRVRHAVENVLSGEYRSAFRGRGMEDDDLEQVAMVGLCKAVQGYQPQGEESSFAAFAVPTITGELKRHFRDHGWLVRPTRELQEVGHSVRNALPTLTQRLQRQPSRGDLADFLGVPARTIAQAQLAQGLYQGWSLDVPVGESATSLGDTFPAADDGFGPLEAALTIDPAVSRLAPRERTILRHSLS